jgi:hypothetical protein
MMKEAIEHGGNGGTIAEQFAPVVHGTIRGEQSAGALIAPHYDFQQVLGGGHGQLPHPQVVDNQKRYGNEPFHAFSAGCIDGSFSQVIEQFVGFAIEHAITLLDSGLSDGLGKMTFAGARWP